ncbi:MAG: TRAP transporter substrate-binding protein DctP, partial [Deltaproteobacteria bacterium]|nr:TRAP transporter substrate-binding protein DctP [Deltaproteobacteria bacterium]
MIKFRLLFVGTVIGIVLIFLASSVLPAEKPITLRFTDQHPPKHFLAQLAFRLAEAVGKRSGGRLKIQVYPSAQLYQDREVIEAVRNMSVEIGNVNIGQWASVYPIMHLIENMPFEVDTSLGYKLIDGKIGMVWKEKMQKIGIMPLMWVPTALHDGLTNNKREIRTPDDFKGLMIRVPHPSIQYRVKVFGGAPVSIAASEMYMALQRGTVDGCWTALASVQARKLYEVQKYLTIFEMGPNFHPTIMNIKSFQNLPKDLQNILLQSALETQKWGRQEVEKEEAEATEKLQKTMRIHILTSEENKIFKDKLKFQT